MFSIVSYIAKLSDLQLFLHPIRASHRKPSACSATTNRMKPRRSLCSVLLSMSDFNHNVTVTHTTLLCMLAVLLFTECYIDQKGTGISMSLPSHLRTQP